MRYAKLILLAGLLLGLTTNAWAIMGSGAVVLKYQDQSMGKFYTDQIDLDGNPATTISVISATTGMFLDPTSPEGAPVYDQLISPWYNADNLGELAQPIANAFESGEDAWGIFKVTSIEMADLASIQNLSPTASGDQIWSELTSSYYLRGMVSGRDDKHVKFDREFDGTNYVTGKQDIESVGDEYTLWSLPKSLAPTWNDVIMQGAAGRAGTLGYEGVTGIDLASGAIAGSIEELTFETIPGFVGVMNETEFYLSGFDASTVVGSAVAVGRITGGASGWAWDTGVIPVQKAGFTETGDIVLNFNDKIDTTGVWSVASDDPVGAFVIPEPVTMLSALLAVSGLAGYVRRRRMG